MKISQIAGWIVFCMLISATALWHAAERPLSIYEYFFLRRLANQQPKLRDNLDLTTLMPGDWELACDAHGYGGDFYLKKYDREYPAVGAMQDGSWGMIFVYPNGKFSSATGNCMSTGVVLNINGCVARANAILTRHLGDSRCTDFSN